MSAMHLFSQHEFFLFCLYSRQNFRASSWLSLKCAYVCSINDLLLCSAWLWKPSLDLNSVSWLFQSVLPHCYSTRNGSDSVHVNSVALICKLVIILKTRPTTVLFSSVLLVTFKKFVLLLNIFIWLLKASWHSKKDLKNLPTEEWGIKANPFNDTASVRHCFLKMQRCLSESGKKVPFKPL